MAQLVLTLPLGRTMNASAPLHRLHPLVSADDLSEQALEGATLGYSQVAKTRLLDGVAIARQRAPQLAAAARREDDQQRAAIGGLAPDQACACHLFQENRQPPAISELASQVHRLIPALRRLRERDQHVDPNRRVPQPLLWGSVHVAGHSPLDAHQQPPRIQILVRITYHAVILPLSTSSVRSRKSPTLPTSEGSPPRPWDASAH